MERKYLLKGIRTEVFYKGTKERSWVADCHYGIKAIDFKGQKLFKGLDLLVQTIALYFIDGDLIIGVHGHKTTDIHKEDTITLYDNQLSYETLQCIYDTLCKMHLNETYNHIIN